MSANIILVGNVTKDPVIKDYTGGRFATFSVANNKKEGTDFYTVSAFGKLSETIEKYLTKGMKVLVNGTFEMREYEKDGSKITFGNVVANSIEFLTKKEDSSVKADDLPF